MVQIIIVFLIIATSMIYIGQLNNAEIMVAPILGVVLGALYSKQAYEEEESVEHTLQCCIFFISLTVVWETASNG